MTLLQEVALGDAFSEGPGGPGWGLAAAGGQIQTDDGVHTDADGGTSGREKPRSGRTSALRARYGLETSQANAAWRAGAMGGGFTASFRCRRIFRMTLTSVMAAMMRNVPC